MEEVKKQFVLLFGLLTIIFVLVFIYKSDIFWNLSEGLPLHTNSGKCIFISDRVCLAEDAGLRLNYYQASSLCSKRGMSLPTLDDAWDIWIASENCQRAFASNQEVAKNKNYFKRDCGEDFCNTSAKNVKNYCVESKIKFPLSSQYKNGSFWLKDGADEGEHYAVNYYSGKVGAYKDNTSDFGVRCVAYKKY